MLALLVIALTLPVFVGLRFFAMEFGKGQQSNGQDSSYHGI
jgi:succinate dehydrogenase/fumarate reductase cytochrome b subunit